MPRLPPVPKVEMCTAEYASALLDPEHTPAGVCIPAGFPLPSQKIKSTCRGTFALGTTGQGHLIFNLQATNDGIAVTATGATSVGTDATVISAFTNLATTSFSNLPYSTAQIVTSTSVAARVVAACIKIRYSGREDGRNGIISMLEDPDSHSVNGLTGTQFKAQTNTMSARPAADESWAQINYSGPTKPSDVEFLNVAQPTSNGVAAFTSAIGFYINGAALDTYEFEGWIHLEYIGSPTSGRTPSHSDTEGYGKVLAAVKSVTADQSLVMANVGQAVASFGQQVARAAPALIQQAISMAPTIANAVTTISGLARLDPQTILGVGLRALDFMRGSQAPAAINTSRLGGSNQLMLTH